MPKPASLTPLRTSLFTARLRTAVVTAIAFLSARALVVSLTHRVHPFRKLISLSCGGPPRTEVVDLRCGRTACSVVVPRCRSMRNLIRAQIRRATFGKHHSCGECKRNRPRNGRRSMLLLAALLLLVLALTDLVSNYATDRGAPHCSEHTTADRVTHGRARAGANRRTFFLRHSMCRIR